MGRERKFTTKELKEYIQLYIEANKHNPGLIEIKPVRVTNYMKENLGLKNAHYQDFTRNEDVMTYIKDLNESMKKKVYQTNVTGDIPAYTPLNITEFLKRNNTKAKLREAVSALDGMIALNVEKHEVIFQKLVKKTEENARLKIEIKSLKNEITEQKKEYEEQLKETKKNLRKTDRKMREYRTRAYTSKHFIEQFHVEGLNEIALYLENLITSEVDLGKKVMMDIEAYKNNEMDLFDTMKLYYSVLPTATVPYNEDEDEYKSYFTDQEIDEDLVNDNEDDWISFPDDNVQNEKAEMKDKENNAANSEDKPLGTKLVENILGFEDD